MREELLRTAKAARAAANCASTASLLPFNACLSAAISSSFCVANASQLFNSSSNLVSYDKSTGTCNSEQLGPTHKLSPNAACNGSSLGNTASSSVRQILRPSITPTDSTRSLGQLTRNSPN